MANFIESMANELNVKESENGAVMYSSTGNALLDMNFSLPSMRTEDEDSIWEKFDNMARPYLNDRKEISLIFKWLFYARDAREGVGERRIFRVIMKRALHDSKYFFFMKDLLHIIPEYGRWDDLISLIDVNDVGSAANKEINYIISEQLNYDIKGMEAQKPISLLAKWLPSINTSSKETRKLGNYIRTQLYYTPKGYRKLLSALRKYIDVTEVKMSGNRWSDINYSAVSSNANLKYANAFMKHDAERRQEYLEELKQGKTKINSKVLFPHEIVAKYRKGSYCYAIYIDDTLEELWKALPNNVDGDQNTLVVCDTSGSMFTPVPGSSSTHAMDVSIALAIYFAERIHGQFKNKMISFSMDPHFVDLDKCSSDLVSRIRFVEKSAEGYNTDISKVFSLILNTAIKNGLKQEDMPDNILLISDMEFDGAIHRNPGEPTHDFDLYKSKFEECGYKLPRIIFWNVNSRTNGIPMKENDSGVALISGFSTNLCKLVMSKEKDPFKALIEQLNVARYQPIEDAIISAYQRQ